MAVSMVIGSYTGAFCNQKGVGYVKIVFIIVTILLILKIPLIILCKSFQIKIIVSVLND